jgi:saccharopine dehydrogenase (NAD+, L-lysine-forming)
MKSVIVLGGCGAVGSVAVKTLATQEDFERIWIADLNQARGEALVKEIGSPKVAFRKVDASDAASVAAAIRDVDLVLNCVGPFYKTVKTILGAAIAEKKNYVDVCDDVDVTIDLLNDTKKAEDAGITALLGMGSSPGVTNLLAKTAAELFLEETHSVDIFHAHGGEPIEGPGVIGHRFHCMSIDIPMFLDGKLQYVKYFQEDGIALRQKFDFPVLGKDIMIYPYPHPEQVTLPRYIKLKQVTNKGTVLPGEYYDLTKDICAAGLASREPVKVNGADIAPYDFAIAYILREREKILKKTNFGTQRGCVSVIVKGLAGGEKTEIRFHLASANQALGEGTGIPAAMGTLLVARGKITQKGIFPPEACIVPTDFLSLVNSIMKHDKQSQAEGGFKGVMVERVDAQGVVHKIDF